MTNDELANEVHTVLVQNNATLPTQALTTDHLIEIFDAIERLLQVTIRDLRSGQLRPQ